MPLDVRGVDEIAACALGVRGGGTLPARPDGDQHVRLGDGLGAQ